MKRDGLAGGLGLTPAGARQHLCTVLKILRRELREQELAVFELEAQS